MSWLHEMSQYEPPHDEFQTTDQSQRRLVGQTAILREIFSSGRSQLLSWGNVENWQTVLRRVLRHLTMTIETCRSKLRSDENVKMSLPTDERGFWGLAGQRELSI